MDEKLAGSTAVSTGVIDDLLQAAYKAAIFNAALQLDIWGKIQAGDQTAPSLAAHFGWDASGVRRLLDALCLLGLLDKTGEVYQATPVARALLEPGSPTFIGDFLLADLGFEGHGLLANAIKSGKRPIAHDWSRGEMSASWVDYEVQARQDPFARLEMMAGFWSSLGIQARDGLRVLDVACGNALHTLALARRHPGVQLTLNDWPGVLENTEKLAARLGVRSQVRLLPGNESFTDFGSKQYDLVFASEFLHFLGPGALLGLLGKLRQALVPGGRLALRETVVDEARCASPALLWSVWLYGASAQGDLYTPNELAGLLEQAGFSSPQVFQEPGSPSAVLVAELQAAPQAQAR